MYAWKKKQHTWIGVWMHCESTIHDGFSPGLVESGADYGVIKLSNLREDGA